MPNNIAVEMLRKYRPRSLNDLAKLNLPKEIKDAMHSQMKVDMVYLGKLSEDRLHGSNSFNAQELVKNYGPSSYNMDELVNMLDMDAMDKGLAK